MLWWLQGVIALALLPVAAPAFSRAALVQKRSPPLLSEPFQIRFDDEATRKPALLEIAQGLALIPVSVAGRNAWALLDNEVGVSLIDSDFARAAGLSVTKRAGTLETGRGRVSLRQVGRVAVVVPGQMRFERSWRAVDLAPMGAVAGRKVDLVLGAEFFGSLAFAIAPEQGRFEVAPSGSFAPPAGTPLLTLSRAHPHVDVVVNGQLLSLIVDLGFDGLVALAPRAWAKVIPADARTLQRTITTLDGKPFSAQSALAQDIRLGPLHVSDGEVSQRPVPAGEDGFLGMGLLLKSSFILDIKAGKLWLLPAAKPRTD